MRIEKIIFKNYRQLRNLEIDFKVNSPDLHLFIAKNGTAKTNILNGINWCLYSEEPHSSSKSQNLPLLNLSVIEETLDNSFLEVVVDLHVRNLDDSLSIFRRSSKFQLAVNDDNYKTANKLRTEFKLFIQRNNEKTEILEEEAAVTYVERFIPSNIRDFYFFNGERLDNYFRETTGVKIKEAINKICGIDTLRQIKSRLQTIEKDLTYDISISVPASINLVRDIEILEKRILENQDLKEQYLDQIRKAKERIEEIDINLRGIPDIDKIEDERISIEKDIQQLNDKLTKAKGEKGNILFQVGKLLFIREHIFDVLDLINKKKETNELPPKYDLEILEESVQCNLCKYSDNELPKKCKETFEKVISSLEFTSNVAIQLTELYPTLKLLKSKIEESKVNIEGKTVLILEIDNEIDRYRNKLQTINNSLETYNSPRVTELVHERKELVDSVNVNHQKIGELLPYIKNDLTDRAIYEKELMNIATKGDFNKKKKLQRLLVVKAMEKIDVIIDNLNNRIRYELELQINKYFKELLWKNYTYDHVEIDKDYKVSLIHRLGYSSLGSASAAETEALALSFTLALHKISGFEGPIFIDTPVARVSDDNRVNMAKVLLNVSKLKQVALLFTPAEFSDDIRSVLLPSTKNCKKLQINTIETEVTLEEL